MLTTYSMWSLFRNCRKACEWRYLEELIPLERDGNLAFGSLIHECLERWHRDRDLGAVLDHIDRACAGRTAGDRRHRDWHLARAMMTGYAARYAVEEFEVVALEQTFEGPIVNPATGAASRSFVLGGKVDGIVRIDGEHYLLKSKTASTVDADYLERLWTDFQIVLYAHYLEQSLGLRIAGVLYNVLVKARLKQGAGETEAEFEERRAALAARNKSGTSTARRRMPESDDEYQARLAERYADPLMFHRERLYFSRDRFEALRAELWELTQSFLAARRRGVFYQNTSFCFQYGRTCPYFPLCRADGNPNLIDNLYERVPPHQELREATAPTDDHPIF
jgi:hypothetical protein